MYTGQADWDLIGKVKNNPRMHIPIIGNGDITNPIIAKEAFDKYGVDAIMIGRAAVGKPWIFRDVKHYLETGEILPPATVAQQVEMLKQQIDAAIDWIDEKRGILHMRRHMAGMFKGLYNFKSTRIEMLRSGDYNDLMLILDRISDQWGESISED
jgi:tRNA-dihydrouridine synthase